MVLWVYPSLNTTLRHDPCITRYTERGYVEDYKTPGYTIWLAVMGMGEMNGVVTHSGRSEVCLNSGPFLDNNNNIL